MHPEVVLVQFGLVPWFSMAQQKNGEPKDKHHRRCAGSGHHEVNDVGSKKSFTGNIVLQRLDLVPKF